LPQWLPAAHLAQRQVHLFSSGALMVLFHA
jgi:hypothetical protein